MPDDTLIADGKVCLSLLGTWTGPSWNATTSTLLQVLVSIQGLILVSEPYFNEPGFEGSLGTKQGTAASKQYNTSIRRHTLKVAIHDQLNNKKSVFRDVILRHCLRKRAKLLAQCDVWEKDAKALEASREKLGKHVDPLHDMALFGQVRGPAKSAPARLYCNIRALNLDLESGVSDSCP